MSWSDIGSLFKGNSDGNGTVVGNGAVDGNGVLEFVKLEWNRFFANEHPMWDSAFEKQVMSWLQGKPDAQPYDVYEAIVSDDGTLLPLPTSRTFLTSKEESILDDNEGIEEEAEQLGFKSSKALKKSLKKLASTYTFSNLDFDRPNPEHPITVSKAPTHSAQQLQIEGMEVENQLGYALARTTHGFDSGSWYFEVQFSSESPQDSHIRLGVAQILAEAQAPVGYDEYSYGIRDKDGTVMHCGREKVYAKSFGPGDVIGVQLSLPADITTASVDKSLRKTVESVYPPKGLGAYKVRQEILADPVHSAISFSINGQSFGSAFSNIYKAKYYPAVSLFGGAKATFNFGPGFVHACPEGFKPAHLIQNTSQ